ncbi:uncharacterized protein THITE_2170696 [Thermothielavioides terrestris NRRL 8126]|jgi:hypothetical protein|uniref:Uncharacterized protein n=2 Tax=Thermothielavioides terrestris TaxID=2587410 RepID=G2R899_THETT|nr:uncharacterized protein THITE_2170696 [Thermothielavioides terrestris NRRL 8126]AEO68158.1 hypothetical protein THITE_2170696 [Thermothielavioides terrestris NRRL 8126]
MCTIGYDRFACGCALPNARTLRKCDWATLKGRAYVCPDFQLSEDAAKSMDYAHACMAHS